MHSKPIKKVIAGAKLKLLSALLSRPAIVARILQILDNNKQGSTELYVYHKDLDVLRYVPSLERVYNNYIKGSATDSDQWMRLLPDFIPADCETIFDVGVNYGHTAAWFSKRAKNVFVFEPDPENQLKVNELLNIRNITNVTIINTAISDVEGTSDFHIKAFSGQNSLSQIDHGDYIKTIQVAVTTIDKVCATHNIQQISLLKIDVEGYEPEVLQGAESMLGKQNIDVIVFEHSPDFYLKRSLEPDVTLTYLDKMHYDVYDMDGHPFKVGANSLKQIDLVAKKRSVK